MMLPVTSSCSSTCEIIRITIHLPSSFSYNYSFANFRYYVHIFVTMIIGSSFNPPAFSATWTASITVVRGSARKLDLTTDSNIYLVKISSSTSTQNASRIAFHWHLLSSTAGLQPIPSPFWENGDQSSRRPYTDISENRSI